MILRVTNPARKRSFRAPLVWVVGPMALIGCVVLFSLLPWSAIMVFFGWALCGLVVYALYGYRRSALAPSTPQPRPPAPLTPKLS
jgi:APA family basic amino acid/polyamine antiporter